jgi:hypothetical protein
MGGEAGVCKQRNVNQSHLFPKTTSKPISRQHVKKTVISQVHDCEATSSHVDLAPSKRVPAIMTSLAPRVIPA